MPKKRSFFERLAGNLRFDDTEDDIDEEIEQPKQEIRRPVVNSEKERREIPVYQSGSVPLHKMPTPEPEEEIGELPVDMYETANEIVIQTLIAGVLPEHLSISITRDMVNITGKREENRAITDDSYHIRELYWGSFGRKVHLPAEVEIDNAEAIERHGMLMIKLPKLDKQRRAVLKIKSI